MAERSRLAKAFVLGLWLGFRCCLLLRQEIASRVFRGLYSAKRGKDRQHERDVVRMSARMMTSPGCRVVGGRCRISRSLLGDRLEVGGEIHLQSEGRDR